MSVTFLCAAIGKPRPTITWYRTIDDSGIQEQINISGLIAVTEIEKGDTEVLSNLTLSKVLPSSAGNYSCIAENDVMHYSGATRSIWSATLTVEGMCMCLFCGCFVDVVSTNLTFFTNRCISE